MLARVGIVQINVTDLDEAWHFYVDKLGMSGRRSLGERNAFELTFSDSGPVVLVYPVQRVVRQDYPAGTGVVLVFYTDDIDATVTEWQCKGVEFIPIAWAHDARGIANSPFGPFIAVRDPFGNVFELVEPRERHPVDTQQ